MKYVSINIKTTGNDFKNNQIIEFSAIIEDTEKKLPFDKIPKFTKTVLNPEYKFTQMSALLMNIRIFEKIQKLERMTQEQLEDDLSWVNLNELSIYFTVFLTQNGFNIEKDIITIAGKNVAGFDLQFLKSQCPEMFKSIRVNDRTIDPAILYIDWNIDTSPPSISEMIERAGVSDTANFLQHDSLYDCWCVIESLRKFY
jgi:DNA polymerase III epsilon subunit-like protein